MYLFVVPEGETREKGGEIFSLTALLKYIVHIIKFTHLKNITSVF